MPNITCAEAAQSPVVYDVDGVVHVEIHWEHDGSSVMPNCDGPLTFVRLVNTGDVVYYCNLPAKKRGLRNFEILPRTDTTYTPQQLRQAGLETYSDTLGVTPHRIAVNLTGQ